MKLIQKSDFQSVINNLTKRSQVKATSISLPSTGTIEKGHMGVISNIKKFHLAAKRNDKAKWLS